MGASLRQPRRHPQRRRLAVPQPRRRHDHGRGAGGDDPGARDPGRARAAQRLQPRRARPRHPGQGRIDRGGHPPARRDQGADHRCALAGMGRRAPAAHLPPRPQRRPAQELGGRRRDRARGAPGADHHGRRDRPAIGAQRAALGLPGCAVPWRAGAPRAPVRLIRDGERAVQDLLPRRIPRPDRGRGRDHAAPAAARTPWRHRQDHGVDPRIGTAHHRQGRSAQQSRRPRPLPAVHDRHRPARGRPDRGPLRGCLPPRPSGDRFPARGHGGGRGSRLQPRLPRSGQALDRQCPPADLGRRHEERAPGSGIPGRAPPPARRGHPPAGGEIRRQPAGPPGGRPLPADPRALPPARAPGGDPG